MQHASVVAHIAPLEDEALGLRGIYRARIKVDGCRAYYGVTRHGQLIGRGLRVVWPGEQDFAIVAELRRELNAVDPIRPKCVWLTNPVPPRPPQSATLREALDLDGHDFARWLYPSPY